MWNIFKKKPVAPAVVPTDTIIPLYPNDDHTIFRAISIIVMFKFDDKLDPEKLHSSLEKLIDRPGWRKLGARIRLNDKGKLEYHVPQDFGDQRHAVNYSHVVYDVDTTEHPVASKLPKPSIQQPAVVSDPYEFQNLMRPEDGPTVLTDYLYADMPILGLHIASFRDSTLVCLSWPHVCFDAMGMRALLDAWILVLQGRESEVRPLHGFDTDPLATLGDNPTEPYKIADRQMSTWQMVGFGIRTAFESLMWSEESRMVCVPASFLKSLRERALRDAAEETGQDKPFLSDGDVLVAWWTRLAISQLPRDSNKTVLISNTYELRSLLAKEMIPEGSAYCGNAVLAVSSFLSASEIYQKPLGHVALAVRRSIAELGTRQQMEAFALLNKEATRKTGYPPMFGDATMHMINYTNWCKAKLYELDFSAALEKESQISSQRLTKPGMPSYIQPCGFSKAFSMRNAFPIVGKDAAGNYWLMGALRKGVWDIIEKELKNSLSAES